MSNPKFIRWFLYGFLLYGFGAIITGLIVGAPGALLLGGLFLVGAAICAIRLLFKRLNF